MVDKSCLFKWPMHRLVNKSNKLYQIYLIKKVIFLVKEKKRENLESSRVKAIVINLGL